MDDKIEKEINAIKDILTALEGLDEETKNNVLEYVLKKLNKSFADFLSVRPTRSSNDMPTQGTSERITETEALHIREFKEKKEPKSAMEMAALVAYYLEHLAPESDRKNKVSSSDMETWFKIADYPLPNIQFLLPNSKNAGYFDSVGTGQYKLNPVGYNLVKHNLPRGEKSNQQKKRSVKIAAKVKK
jgi:hypothetical protein